MKLKRFSVVTISNIEKLIETLNVADDDIDQIWREKRWIEFGFNSEAEFNDYRKDLYSVLSNLKRALRDMRDVNGLYEAIIKRLATAPTPEEPATTPAPEKH